MHSFLSPISTNVVSPFNRAVRQKFFDISMEHGVPLELANDYGNIQYLITKRLLILIADIENYENVIQSFLDISLNRNLGNRQYLLIGTLNKYQHDDMIVYYKSVYQKNNIYCYLTEDGNLDSLIAYMTAHRLENNNYFKIHECPIETGWKDEASWWNI